MNPEPMRISRYHKRCESSLPIEYHISALLQVTLQWHDLSSNIYRAVVLSYLGFIDGLATGFPFSLASDNICMYSALAYLNNRSE